MAKFALISGVDVVNVVVSDSEEQLGVVAELFDVVEVTYNAIVPSTGWTYENGTFFPPKLADDVKPKWNGAGFDYDDVVDAEEVTDEDDK